MVQPNRCGSEWVIRRQGGNNRINRSARAACMQSGLVLYRAERDKIALCRRSGTLVRVEAILMRSECIYIPLRKIAQNAFKCDLWGPKRFRRVLIGSGRAGLGEVYITKSKNPSRSRSAASTGPGEKKSRPDHSERESGVISFLRVLRGS